MNGYDNSVNSTSAPPSEPPVQKRRLSNRVQIQNLPAGFTQEGIDKILSSCGAVKKTHITNADTGASVKVIFENAEDAQKAVEHLNDLSYEGSNLKAELMANNPMGAGGNPRFYRNNYVGGRPKNGLQPGANRGTGYPLRILVPSEYVGAIIGRKGATIRTITTRCKARVDVHGKENSGLVEKIISIFGHPENCTNACKEILLVIQQEATTNQRGEVMLKMLTDDRYCGRIIGKEGKMIKKIRDETSTKITVSNAQEMAALFPDRVICVRGSVDGMSQAESAISAKLSECMEHELQQGGMMMMPLSMNPSYYPNNRPYDGGYYAPLYAPMGARSSIDYQGAGVIGSSPLLGGGLGGSGGESCQIAVPNAAVGAIIGTAGANIKQMMRESAAFVNIESKKDGDPTVERLVTIKGNADACWRASYMVFEKMKLEGFGGMDDVRLKTIIRVPRSVVGRIIGKGGKNVRELQHMTGAMVKLPEDPATQGEEVAVEVYGNFMATQNAHSRIRAMVSETQRQNTSNGGTGPRGGPRRPPMGPQDARLLADTTQM